MRFLRSLWLRLRCSFRTHGLHQLDIHVGRCRHCGRPWQTVYRATPAPYLTDLPRDQEGAWNSAEPTRPASQLMCAERSRDSIGGRGSPRVPLRKSRIYPFAG
jgi:hypothetical protein